MTGPTSAENPEALRLHSLHHVGYVVASIAKTAESFARSVNMTWSGTIFHDPAQAVQVTFLRSAIHPEQPMIELVEPAGPGSPVASFLKRGGGLHHLCHEVRDLDRFLASVRERGPLVIGPPQPAVAFGGRRIAWVYTPERLLLEYLES